MSFSLCVVGCGGIATGYHGPSYVRYRDTHPGFVLSACCDLDAERAEAFQKRFGFERAYTQLNEMLQKESPDAVCVLVNERFTAEVASRVLRARIPMLIEKPPGKTSSETRMLAELAETLNVPSTVAFNRRHIPLMRRCRDWIESLDAKISYIRYDFFRTGRNDEDFSDTAVHGIDAVRFLTGADYDEVRFQRQKNTGAADDVYMDAKMSSGAHAQLNFCPGSGVTLERATIHVGGTTLLLNLPIWGYGYDTPGSLTMLGGGNELRSLSGLEACDSQELPVTNGFYDENRAFFDALMSGEPLAGTIRDAIQTMLVKERYADGTGQWQSG